MKSRPLIVRLRNWVGDVILGVPALRLLQSQSYQLRLVGKPWAASLLAGEGWAVESLAVGGLRQRVAQLRRLRRDCAAQDREFDRRLNTLVLPFSLSSALDARLAGLRAVGYAHEGRSLLMRRAVPRRNGIHELRSYWDLACALLNERSPPPPPAAINLAISDEARQAARHRLVEAGVQHGESFILLCPFAGGTFEGQNKRWPDFPRLAAAASLVWDGRLLMCPGPGEAEQARADYPAATVLDNVSLGVYAALLRRCALMVSNDTGPGHLAAAVGAPLLSVLGPTDAAQWGPWGRPATVIQEPGGWPSVAQVLSAGSTLLAAHEAGGLRKEVRE